MEPAHDAWELVERVWMTDGPFKIALPIDPVAIARKLGIEVLRDDELPPEVSGILRKAVGFEDPEIRLNAIDARVRRRFTCAHALGHYSRNIEMRRHEAWEFIEGRDYLTAPIGDVEEAYATEFAAELLVPWMVLREFGDTSSVAALAGAFQVPGDVMGFRLDRIGWPRR
jgi:hypothetical protein